jgi:hypothetical protein
MLLQREVSGNADLESVRDIKLRLVSRETSLQRLAVFVPNLRELDLEGSCLGSLRYRTEHTTSGIINSYASSVGIATGYCLDCRGSILGRGTKFHIIAHCSDRLWDPPSPLSNLYGGLTCWGVNMTIHFRLLQSTNIVELYLHSPICLHGVVVN